MIRLNKAKKGVKVREIIHHGEGIQKEEIDILSPYPYSQITVDGKKLYMPKKGVKKGQMPYYKKLKTKYPELKQYKDGDIYKYTILFNKIMLQSVVDNKAGVEMPEHIGNLVMGAYKRKAKRIDWGTSREKGEVVHYNDVGLNYGLYIQYVYSLEKYNFTNCNLWTFKTSGRDANKALREAIEKGWKNYLMIPNIRYIQSFVKDYWIKERIKKQQAEERAEYNEFEGLI